MLYLSMLVIALALALTVVVRIYADRVSKLKERIREIETSKRSLSATYGNITEQWAPFMSGYPYDPRNFRFLGSPIDGVQFEDDKIVFVEFKANQSRLTPPRPARCGRPRGWGCHGHRGCWWRSRGRRPCRG